jgi:DNA-directed RNA polymerase sigma subunit (sigma70/sigma32)
MYKPNVSIEAMINDHRGNPTSVIDLLPAQQSAELVALRHADAELVANAFAFLDEVSQRVLELRLGLTGPERTVSATAKLLGLRKADVESVYETALLQLRDALTDTAADDRSAWELAA